MESRPTTILAIDDDPRLCLTISRWLEVKGNYRAIAVTDGRQGLKLAKREKPDLILLDLVMPGIDGIEVLKKLNKSAATRYIPVVILTGSPSIETREDAEYEYAEHYLTKPIDSETLLAKIESILKRRGVAIPREEG
jgi:CheY-like chemotaxis protein